MAQAAQRTSRIEARIAPEALEIVKYAAQMEGRSLSDFVTTAAYEMARDRIDRYNRVKLTIEESKRFFELVDSPIDTPQIEKTRAAQRRLIRNSE